MIRISVKAAGLKLQLLPRPKKKPKKDKPEKEKPEKEKTPKEKKPKEEKETKKKKSLPFNAEEILELLRAVTRRDRAMQGRA